MNKFENVNVVESLRAIMKQNTAHYQSDLDIDEKIIRAAVESTDKNLLWFPVRLGHSAARNVTCF